MANSDEVKVSVPLSNAAKQMSAMVPKSLSGLWGEALVVKELREHGFSVRWDGGLTHGHDLVAERDGNWWLVQVKTTQNKKGWIAWGKDGSSALALDEKARNAGGAGAFYVLVQIHDQGEHSFDLDAGVLTIKIPTNAALVALSAAQLAESVDGERTVYGQTPRSRTGRNGEAVGTLHSADGLLYPLATQDHPYLHEFAATL
ncbi:hypothetical protein [Arthrobacter sp. Z1-15]